MQNENHPNSDEEFRRSSHLTLALCVVVLLVMVASAALIGRSLYVLSETRKIAVRAVMVDSDLKDLTSEILEAETSEHNFFLSSRPIYLQPYFQALATIARSRVALGNALQKDPSTANQLVSLDKAVATELQKLEKSMRLKSAGIYDEAGGLGPDDTGKETMDAVLNAIRALASHENSRTDEWEAEYVREIHNNYWIISVSLALNLLFFFGLVQRMRYAAAQGQTTRQEMEEHNNELSLFLKSSAERNAQVNGLSELSRFLQSSVNMEEALCLLKQQLPPLLKAESGVLYLLANDRDQLCQAFAWGAEPYSECFEPGECWAVRLGQPFRQPAQPGAAACKHLESKNSSIRKDIHCLPLVAHGELLGLLVLDAGIASGAATNLENEGYRRITLEQVGLSIGNLKLRESLHQQSIRDALTGLYNRRFLEEAARREMLRASRLQAEGGANGITFLMIDIDHFKRFNDEFGHKVGDQVLREVADTLQQDTRGSDVVARYGGEEFTIVLTDTSIEFALKRAEKVRQDVESMVLLDAGKSVGKITISIGLAQFPVHGSTVAALLLAADKALYEAKSAGRNRLVVASDAGREMLEPAITA